MKTTIKILSAVCFCLLCISCQPSTSYDYKRQFTFYLFQFSDPEYQHHIFAKLDTFSSDGKDKIILPSAFPRRDLHEEYYYYENKYLFIDKEHGFVRCDTAAIQQEIEKTNLCDLSQEPRLIELADGYYTWYPFTAIPVKEIWGYDVSWWKDERTRYKLVEMPVVVLSARWEDICSFDMDTVQIISYDPYSQVFPLVHMYQYTRDMGIDEMVDIINRLIKEKDFAHGGHESHPWFK